MTRLELRCMVAATLLGNSEAMTLGNEWYCRKAAEGAEKLIKECEKYEPAQDTDPKRSGG